MKTAITSWLIIVTYAVKMWSEWDLASCLMVGFCNSSAEPLGSAAREIVFIWEKGLKEYANVRKHRVCENKNNYELKLQPS
jgi:hypothetical protein